MIRVRLPGAEVVFSTRQGGVSQGPYASLNLGVLTDDDPLLVAENRRLLAEAAGVDATRVAMGRQVHGTAVLAWDDPPGGRGFARPGASLEAADAHTTSTPGLALLVIAADCLPVALAGGGRVAMAHCGWRGLAGGIIGAVAARFEDPPAAAIGPGIGPCCYEVGDEVLKAFADVEGAATVGRGLDLAAVARARLRAAGVRAVEHVDLCTSCHPELFFSHRRDGGVTGRQGGLAWLR